MMRDRVEFKEKKLEEQKCPHCGSKDIEYVNIEWFCNNCDEQWGRDGGYKKGEK